MNDNPEDSSPITSDHYTVFGGIIHLFAKIEVLMQATISALIDNELITTMALTSELGYRAKRTALLNTAKLERPDIVNQLEDLLDRIHTKSRIRNNIAHTIWDHGQKPGTIKPMGLLTRSGTPKLVGAHHNEKEWSIDELWKEAADLELLHAEFGQFLDDSGLKDIIERKMVEMASDSDDDPGMPSAK